MRVLALRFVLAGLVLVAMTAMLSGEVAAQCSTCAAPTVAYQPVVAQPTMVYKPYTGWYPGKLIDRWRMRGAKVSTVVPAYSAPTYTAAYSPYSAGYTPYSAGYSPYTAAYTPYVSAYAPLSAPVSAGCNTCAQTSYYPVAQTLARPVVMQPVVTAGCSTCSSAPACSCGGCGSCDSCCSAGVSQAAYTTPSYSQPACSSCAGGSTVSPAAPAASYGQSVGPQTPQPTLEPEPAPQGSTYRSNRPAADGDNRGLVLPEDTNEVDPLEKFDPGPAAEQDSSTFNAPRLFDPSDRTALRRSSHKPTVNVWQAVYRKQPTKNTVSQTSTRRARTQAEIDAEGWAPVRRNR